MIGLAHLGVVDRPDGEGVAGGGACNDRIRVTIRVADGRLEQVRVAADACATATAAALALAASAEGAGLLDAARLGSHTLDALGIAGPCAARGVDAFHAAIGDAVAGGLQLVRTDGRVVVGVSGGVDSAVAVAELCGAGHDVVGVTLRLWIDPLAPSPERACCAPEAVRAARRTCHEQGVPHIGLDLRSGFRAAVVDGFVDAYARGDTPNPCITCNGSFRFDALLAVATQLGAAEVGTGHYARIVERDGRRLLGRGADQAKDQSYMLARLDPGVLGRVVFPLGDRTKTWTRQRALELGITVARAPESQEVCFLGGGALRPFLEREGVDFEPGMVEGEDGSPLGRHDGVAAFTPGQRRGIGVGSTGRLHVLTKDVVRNVVVLAPRERLGRRRIELRNVSAVGMPDVVNVQLRHRAPTIPGRLDGETLLLDAPAFGVAPGQIAVCYADDAIVAVGEIAASYSE